MYAVIVTGGKQYQVKEGDTLKVELLELAPGDDFEFDKVLLIVDGDKVEVGAPYLKAKVKASVVGHGRGDKIKIIKMRRRKHSRTQAGHRQYHTEVVITGIEQAA